MVDKGGNGMTVSPKLNTGFTLTAVVVASLIGAVLAGGTMMAFVTARKISYGVSSEGDAAYLAQQSLENYRNMVACDSSWFTPATCTSGALPSNTPDPLSGSPLQSLGATRKYTVTPDDCDGDGTPGDCFKVTVNVHWTPLQ